MLYHKKHVKIKEVLNMKILVTGATGKLGSLVIENLLKNTTPENIAVSVRDTAKAQHLKDKGIDVRYGDFDKPESLKDAFKKYW